MSEVTPESEALWKKRFEAFALVRLSGLLMLFGGLVVALKNPLGDEYPVVGGIIAVLGLGDLLLGPKMLRKIWDEQDSK